MELIKYLAMNNNTNVIKLFLTYLKQWWHMIASYVYVSKEERHKISGWKI